MATYQILYWHDIPVQVRAKDAGGRAGAELPARFQEAIDQAAMAAGLIGSDDYTEAFRWGEQQERAQTNRMTGTRARRPPRVVARPSAKKSCHRTRGESCLRREREAGTTVRGRRAC